MKKKIEVVGAVIFSGDKILCDQRSNNMSLPLKWEFPGGKVEENESELSALHREIKEEMLCDIKIGEKITATVYEYDFGIVHLHTYKCTLQKQLPNLIEHQKLKLLQSYELEQLDWAPADIPTVKILSGRYQ